jgi:uncharacterized membrane protein
MPNTYSIRKLRKTWRVRTLNRSLSRVVGVVIIGVVVVVVVISCFNCFSGALI